MHSTLGPRSGDDLATRGHKLDNFGHNDDDEPVTDRWAIPRTCASAAILTDLAAEHGVPARVVLDGTGIAEPMLRDPDAEIATGQELQLVRNLVAELGHIPGLGLEAGTRYHATTHGVWGFAVISSPTVRHALEVSTRYFELSFSFADVRVEESTDLTRVTLDDARVPEEIRLFHLERDLAAIATVLDSLLSTTVVVREFTVALPPPGYAGRYQEIFAHAPRFDAPKTSIAVDAAALDLPLPQANPHTAAICERQCADILQRRHERLGLAGQVREVLLRRRGVAEQEDVAAELNLSVRTLRRRLADEDTSYRELAAETSGMLAEELLTTGLAAESVAHRLGYSGAAAFTRAFKAWKGTTPGAYARATRH